MKQCHVLKLKSLSNLYTIHFYIIKNLFQSNIKNETTYLQDVQEDCFYTEQNTSMRGKISMFIILTYIVYLTIIIMIKVVTYNNYTLKM